jgi:creatinine amidohydrolase
MRFTDLTYEELGDLAPRVAAVLIPLGCTEQQGPHLTVDFDTLMVTRLCEDIAASLDQDGFTVLVVPALPFGPTPEHVGFGHGFVNLRQSTHEAIVEDILDSLSAQNYRTLLLWRGCGQHELGDAVHRFNARHDEARAYQPLIDYGTITTAVLGNVPGGHADSLATSVCLFLDEANVRTDRIRLPHNRPFDWNDAMNFAEISDTGVIGDPTRSSREAGERLWRLCVDEGARTVLEILAQRPVRESWHFKPWREQRR